MNIKFLSELKFKTNPEDIQKENQNLIVHYVENDNNEMSVTINDSHFEVKTGLDSYDFLCSPLIFEASGSLKV